MSTEHRVGSVSHLLEGGGGPISVTARFFAAAEECVGSAELVLELPSGATIRDALASASGLAAMPAPASETAPASAPALASTPDIHPVLGRCSFLLNTHAVTDATTELHAGDVLDVLPPFAGG